MFAHITNTLLKANTDSEDKLVIEHDKRTKRRELSAKGKRKYS